MDIAKWIGLAIQIQQAGERGLATFQKIRAVAADDGFDVDAEMDKVIANATKREAIALDEAK